MEEIKTIVFSMDSDKAPEPDGMSALFFKHYRHLIGDDIVDGVLSFFRGDRMLREINHTFVTLIPKHERAAMANQCRPISLCNVLYEIISKLLANKLRPLLHKIISPRQAAFIQGRKIQDNSIIAHEIIHAMRKKKDKEKWIAIKLDMEKAYDRLEWPFILNVLRKFGFNERWINWISECISTTSFSILINGSPYGFFQSQRGLR